jgi:hypothetical protein
VEIFTIALCCFKTTPLRGVCAAGPSPQPEQSLSSLIGPGWLSSSMTGCPQQGLLGRAQIALQGLLISLSSRAETGRFHRAIVKPEQQSRLHNLRHGAGQEASPSGLALQGWLSRVAESLEGPRFSGWRQGRPAEGCPLGSGVLCPCAREQKKPGNRQC